LDLAVAVSWSRGPRFACRRDDALRGDAFVCLDAAQPGSIVGAQGTSAIAAVPRDRANERSDVLEKIVVGELNILPVRHISHNVKYVGL
jgi:hypothetical protein